MLVSPWQRLGYAVDVEKHLGFFKKYKKYIKSVQLMDFNKVNITFSCHIKKQNRTSIQKTYSCFLLVGTPATKLVSRLQLISLPVSELDINGIIQLSQHCVCGVSLSLPNSSVFHDYSILLCQYTTIMYSVDRHCIIFIGCYKQCYRHSCTCLLVYTCMQ